MFLSSPNSYKKIFKKEIGEVKDLSQERISIFNNEFNELKGLSLNLRMLVAKICSLPYIGNIIMKILSNFIMMEILVRKNDRLEK